jgi:hypothetical protein
MGPGSKIDSARDAFEIDRKAFLRQVRALLRTIHDASTELAMVAAENVFDKRVSAALEQKARTMRRAVQKLDSIGDALSQAKFPRAQRSCAGARKRR